MVENYITHLFRNTTMCKSFDVKQTRYNLIWQRTNSFWHTSCLQDMLCMRIGSLSIASARATACTSVWNSYRLVLVWHRSSCWWLVPGILRPHFCLYPLPARTNLCLWFLPMLWAPHESINANQKNMYIKVMLTWTTLVHLMKLSRNNLSCWHSIVSAGISLASIIANCKTEHRSK